MPFADELTVPSLIHRAGTAASQRAVVFEGGQRTYGELRDRSRRVAQALRALGVAKGDRVLVLLPNRLEFWEINLGIMEAGGIVVPLNTRFAPPEVANLAVRSGATVMISTAEHAAHAQAAAGQIRIHVHVGEGCPPGSLDLEELVAAQDPEPPGVPVGTGDPCEIIYTSGTTGVPKGAVWTHRTVIWNSIQQCLDYNLTARDSTYVTLGSFYIGGRHDLTMPLFHQGGCVHLRRLGSFDAAEVLTYVAAHGITTILLVPTMLYDVLQTPVRHQVDLSRLRLILCGAAPVPVPLIEQTVELLPHVSFVQVYGATEAGGTVAQLKAEDALRKAGSCGRATIHNDLTVVDEEGAAVPPEGIGEIVVRGPAVFPGYWENPEATGQVLREDGLHTGDLGRFDEEGYLYIVGRKKDVIISGGMNIYPEEVELLLRRYPDIADVAVIGVPDERWGESVLAVVQPAAGHTVTAEEVVGRCRAGLASYKKPRYVEFTDELPRTASGKVQKHELRARYHPRYAAAVGGASPG